MNGPQTRNLKQNTAGCTPSSTFAWLNINNARVRVNAGGDMWWDLPGGSGAKYYIPANGAATALYAGSLWIAGMDINNQLKCAAIRFRQVGNDFWTGPLTIDGTASIDAETCMEYDKMYNMTRKEVDDFLADCNDNGIPQHPEKISENILNWPAHGDPARGMSYYLAPFYDNDKDGNYDPTQGDYPYYDVKNELCHKKDRTMEDSLMGTVHGSILSDQVIKGDQTIWWVFNDKGNAHTETGGSAIGMEIRAQAFAFATNDEINNMTFYSYEIINRSTYTLTNTYFSPWTDVDLGYAKDDYVGCDVARGLGYGYNGTNVDGTGQTEAYGANPPAVGVDFFQGPYLDPDGLDNPKYDVTIIGADTILTQRRDESINGVNFGNGIVDDERYGMRRFVYHNNTDSPINGDPDVAAEYYLLLRGIWKNGAKMEYGGTAVPNAAGTVGPQCDFMFPFDSDPWNWGTGGIAPNGGFNTNGFYWSEETGNEGKPNAPDDRRFMQSAGPFTLKSGAVNYITFGVPWARSTEGTAWASVELLRRVDDKCQNMFDKCFKVLDGPDAPDLIITEMDKKLVFYISNPKDSNNYKEEYAEKDDNIPNGYDKYYRFEGYQVYQLANKEVNADELSDNTKARLVMQCDIKNNVSRIVNFIYDENLHFSVPTLMVEGGDNGIQNTFMVTQDLFTTNSDPSLVNHHTYYYMAIAYAYNNYYTYDPETTEGFGQKTPYLAGRKRIKLYDATPHKIMNGTVVNSSYGDKPVITRWCGFGNGGNRLELSDADVEELLHRSPASETNLFGMDDYPVIYHPTYKKGYGPIDVKIVDPLNVKATDYAIWFHDFEDVEIQSVTGDPSITGDKASKNVFRWTMKDLSTDSLYKSDTTTVLASEKVFLDLGISVSVTQSWNPGPTKVGTQGSGTNLTDSYANLEPKNGLIMSSVTYADSSYRWLSGIMDSDRDPTSPLNWIRAGLYGDQGDKQNNDYIVSSSTLGGTTKAYDPDEEYEKIANGTWAPYIVCNVSGNSGAYNPGPVFKGNSRVDSIFKKATSVDIVLTDNKDLWTRCPVIEMSMEKSLAENQAAPFGIRKAASVDKNGNPYMVYDTVTQQMVPYSNFTQNTDISDISDNPEAPNYISPWGMGWFPGYVIDIESGARLNVAFGEDSFYGDTIYRGRDMMFNPPHISEMATLGYQSTEPLIFNQIDGTAIFGAKHYVYIFPMNYIKAGSITMRCPAYDAGKYVLNKLNECESNSNPVYKIAFWQQPIYVGMPMAVAGKKWLPKNNPVKISIRMSKPYKPGYATTYLDVLTDNVYDTVNHKGLLPYYTFTTKGCAPTYNDPDKTESDLSLIQVVPNPYYAYSNYEPNALTHKVKITNLPDKCVVTIYATNGTKIRQFKKDNSSVTSLDWDLTNHANTPIASGIYIIHVKDNTSGGEQTLKFYCAMRQVDLNTF